MIKAVIFDLDNTLIDFMLMKRKSCEAAIDAMKRAGLKVGRSRALKALFELYSQHGMEDRTIFQKLLRKLIKRIDYRLLAEGIVAYRQAQVRYIRPYPGTLPMLKKLRGMGIRLAIVSDAPSVNAWIRLVEMGMQDLFDAVVTFHDTGKTKPSPLPFRRALKKLGVRPEHCLFVGDYIEKDIQGANALGMVTAFAKYGAVVPTVAGRTRPYRPVKSGADYDISSVSDVIDIVKKENNL